MSRHKLTSPSVSILLLLLTITFNNIVFSKTHDTLNKVLLQYDVEFKNGGSFNVVRDFKFTAKEKTFHTIIAKGKNTRFDQ